MKRAVNLSAIGSDVEAGTGHFEGFHHLEQTLNELTKIDLVHLRASWFMEDLRIFIGGIVKHGAIGWSVDPSVKTSWVATGDIADFAAKELIDPTGEHRAIRELGSEDVTMPEMAGLMSRESGRPVEYRFVDRRRKEVEAEFLARSGTHERFVYDTQTLDALNDGRVRFHGGDRRPQLPTKLAAFLRETWKPQYQASLDRPAPDDFQTWCARPSST